jgi:hypothetical protein
MCRNWSMGTHTRYQRKLEIIRGFEPTFGVVFYKPRYSTGPVATHNSHYVDPTNVLFMTGQNPSTWDL